MSYFRFVLQVAVGLALSLSSLPALAQCVGAANGLCEAPEENCLCADCATACEGGCTPSNPPACTFEDACTCMECWTDSLCTDPKLDNCKDNGKCDPFVEGCCCADCAGVDNCIGFSGNCSMGGTGGNGGAGGAGGGTGGTSSTGGAGGTGGVPLNPPGDGGCGCTAAGATAPAHAGALGIALGLSALLRRRRRSQSRPERNRHGSR